VIVCIFRQFKVSVFHVMGKCRGDGHTSVIAGGKMRTVDLRTGKGVNCEPNLRTLSAFYPRAGR